MEIKKNAVEYIHSLIKELGTRISKEIVFEDTKYVPFQYSFRIIVGDEYITIIFGRPLIEDLEIALEKYRNTKYFDTLDSNVKFTVLIELGQRGLLNNYPISTEIINDKRDWIKSYDVRTEFDEEMTELLYGGLNKLGQFFDGLTKKHEALGIQSDEIMENKEWVQNLIEYYEKHKNLNSSGVGIKNLEFLKTAAIKEVMDLEELRNNENIPTTWRALNKKIYDIVVILRRDPFLEINLPDFIHDIVPGS